jgi:hypothetical protein
MEVLQDLHGNMIYLWTNICNIVYMVKFAGIKKFANTKVKDIR